MKMSRAFGVLVVLLGLAGCGTTPSSIVQQPTTARPQAQPVQAAANGAIYQSAAYRPLFEDRRARHVGDVLTIVINEKTQAGKKAASNGAKTGAVDSSISAVANLPLKTLPGCGGEGRIVDRSTTTSRPSIPATSSPATSPSP